MDYKNEMICADLSIVIAAITGWINARQTYKGEIKKSVYEERKQVASTTRILQSIWIEDLCFLSGKYLDDYLYDVEICQAFARRSRERMAEIILERTEIIILHRTAQED